MKSPRQWRGEQDTGSQTRARHAAAVSIPSTCAIEPWSSRPTVAARIEHVNRGGTANRCLDRTCECVKRRRNEPELNIDQLICETSAQRRFKAKRHVRWTPWSDEQRWQCVPSRTTTVTSDRREHLWLDSDHSFNWNENTKTMVTQPSHNNQPRV
jgi:hypothetical protein